MPLLTPSPLRARLMLRRQWDNSFQLSPSLPSQHARLATSSKRKPKTTGNTNKQAATVKAEVPRPPAEPSDPLAAAQATSSRLSAQFAQFQSERHKVPSAAATPVSAPDNAAPSEEELKPQPLTRPLGVPKPPVAGENSGIDARGLRQRRDDLFDWEKHLARRKELTAQIAKPYFRDWSNMQYQKGKVFVAPSRVFRADRAQFFPNLRGITLDTPHDERDTTPVLAGRISLVSVYTGDWAQQQTRTFWQDNQALADMLEAGQGLVQCAEVNVEEKRLRYALVRAFLFRQRARLAPEEHSRYFAVHRGFDQRLKEQLGMFNGHVGYLFLLDWACRVRWAASAEAQEGEADSLNRGILRLAKEQLELAQQLDRGEKILHASPQVELPLLDAATISKKVEAMSSALGEAEVGAREGV